MRKTHTIRKICWLTPWILFDSWNYQWDFKKWNRCRSCYLVSWYLVLLCYNMLQWKNKATAEWEFSQMYLVFICHLFHLGLILLVSLSSFLLKRRVKQEPEKPDALAEQTSPRRENLSFPCKLTACNLFQNICFNGSRETRVSSPETRETSISSLETRLSSHEKQDKGW